MAAALALMASLLWGGSDFAGGLFSRRLPVSVVIGVSQAAAFFASVAVFVVAIGVGDIGFDAGSTTRSAAWGAVSGVVGLVGLGCFYSGLAAGAMGVVAPIASMGVVVPVLVGLVRGDRPSIVQLVGIGVAVVGVLLVARTPSAATQPATRAHRRAVGLALGAAAGFGVGILAIAEGGAGGSGNVLVTLVAQRSADILVIGGFLAVRGIRSGLNLRADMPGLVAIGLVDLSANGAYAYATLHGLVSVVSVLSSLYPVVTALLARQLLRERLARAQIVGIGASLTGVVLLGAG